MPAGAGSVREASAGTLVERATGFVVLVKMDNAITEAAVDSFSAVLNRKLAAMRKTLTGDHGRETHGHKILTERDDGVGRGDPQNRRARGAGAHSIKRRRRTMATTKKFLRPPAVIDATGQSRSTILRAVKAGEFPSPVHIGIRVVAWDADTIATSQLCCIDPDQVLQRLLRHEAPKTKKANPKIGLSL